MILPSFHELVEKLYVVFPIKGRHHLFTQIILNRDSVSRIQIFAPVVRTTLRTCVVVVVVMVVMMVVVMMMF